LKRNLAKWLIRIRWKLSAIWHLDLYISDLRKLSSGLADLSSQVEWSMRAILNLEESADPRNESNRERLLRNFVPSSVIVKSTGRAIITKRYGRMGDGGYTVVLPLFDSDIVISAGLGNDVSFEDDVLQEVKTVIGLDHTIKPLPNKRNFVHLNKALRPSLTNDSETLANLLAFFPAQDYILKIDIEGDEWPVFDGVDESILKKFRQIIVEFHGFASFQNELQTSKMLQILEKLEKTHQVVSSHANNFGIYRRFGSLLVPDVIEVTYLRRDSQYKFVPIKYQPENVIIQNSDSIRPISDEWLSQF
jgi:Methyltransferase FkbM domain